MTTILVTEPAPHPDFGHLAAIVRELSATGKNPTAAGVKNALVRREPEFSERALGFKKFIDYLRAAEQAGLVFVGRDELGHPRVSTDPIADATPGVSDVASVSKIPRAEPIKLRSDVWLSVIDWSVNARRVWDRHTSRAFMFPTDTTGEPLWLTEPQRFVDITPVDRDLHLKWMDEFARSLPDEQQHAILESLRDGAPRGEFKRTLHSFDLEQAWSDTLQARAADHVRRWAAEHTITSSRLFDKRTSPAPHPGPRHAAPSVAVETAPPPPGTQTDMTGGSADSSDTERLRQRLHHAIDTMTLGELSSIQVPARYLILE